MLPSRAQRKAQHHSRTLAVGLVPASLLAASTMLVPERARADTALIVTSTADPGNGVCDTVCTLRGAISAVNDARGREPSTSGSPIPER